jgi:phosphatidylinositol alpha-1,6-mannosyltransferase
VKPVIFTGRLPFADVVHAYGRCGVFCMPSCVETGEPGFWSGEGFGIVYIEAAACGRPVIASTDGRAPETLIPNVTGLLVNPLEPDDVADAIARIRDDQAAADEMEQRGRAFVIRTFARQVFESHIRDLVDSFTRTVTSNETAGL